jgi:hypothetical protein
MALMMGPDRWACPSGRRALLLGHCNGRDCTHTPEISGPATTHPSPRPCAPRTSLKNTPTAARPRAAHQAAAARRAPRLTVRAAAAAAAAAASEGAVLRSIATARAQEAAARYEKEAAGWTPVKFALRRKCELGESWKVVGPAAELGRWSPDLARRMTWGEGDVWTATVKLAPGEHEFKVRPGVGGGGLGSGAVDSPRPWEIGSPLARSVTTAEAATLHNQPPPPPTCRPPFAPPTAPTPGSRAPTGPSSCPRAAASWRWPWTCACRGR